MNINNKYSRIINSVALQVYKNNNPDLLAEYFRTYCENINFGFNNNKYNKALINGYNKSKQLKSYYFIVFLTSKFPKKHFVYFWEWLNN